MGGCRCRFGWGRPRDAGLAGEERDVGLAGGRPRDVGLAG